MKGLFISGTGTGVGKTWLARGLTRLATNAGKKVAALKPIETGVRGTPEDALALGRAAGRPELAFVPGLIRRSLAASPYAAQLAGEPALDPDALVTVIRETAVGSDLVIVEGAGGLFVPLDAAHTVLDLVLALELPLVLVAPNRLGVLSDAIATVLAARAAGLEAIALVLSTSTSADASTPYNAAILRQYLDLPVHELRATSDDDELLARSVSEAGLEELLGLGRPTLDDG